MHQQLNAKRIPQNHVNLTCQIDSFRDPDDRYLRYHWNKPIYVFILSKCEAWGRMDFKKSNTFVQKCSKDVCFFSQIAGSDFEPQSGSDRQARPNWPGDFSCICFFFTFPTGALKTGSSENIQAEIQLWIPVAFLFSFLTADMNGLQAMAMYTMQRPQLQE